MPQTLTPSDLETFRVALNRKYSELMLDWLHTDEIAVERFPDAMDDVVSANQRDLAVDRMHRNALLLSQIAQALHRMTEGGYGLCAECGQPIPVKRLTALPWAILCVSCQDIADRNKPTTGIPAPGEQLPGAA